jgi:hypothetical protein
MPLLSPQQVQRIIARWPQSNTPANVNALFATIRGLFEYRRRTYGLYVHPSTGDSFRTEDIAGHLDIQDDQE